MSKENMKELCLALMFLSGWEEDSRKTPGEKTFCSWKGYSFQALNALADEKQIIQFKDKKLVILTDAGVERAKQVLTKLFPEKKKKTA